MPRIAFLTSHPIQHQAPLFRALVAAGADVTVFMNWEAAARKPVFDKEFGRAIQWDTPILTGYRYKFLRNFSPRPSSEFWGQINPGIIKEVWTGRYDALAVFGWNAFTNWLAFAAAILSGTPLILRAETPENQEKLKNPLKRKIKKIILWPLFKLIRAFLYIGEENKRFYKEEFGVPDGKLFFCPYADENERYIAEAEKYLPRRAELRKEFGLPEDKAVILFAGKFVDKKRPLDLLRAYAGLGHDSAALVLVGDGPLRPEMEKYIEAQNIKGVHLPGFQNLTELPRWYAASDILVLPSESGETWGLVVNIAMCFKMPVIVSDLVGCGSDLVHPGVNGYVFKAGDTAELARELRKLIADPGKCLEFGRKSFEIVQAYTFAADARGILAALGSLR